VKICRSPVNFTEFPRFLVIVNTPVSFDQLLARLTRIVPDFATAVREYLKFPRTY
jgi:hypothetical protein